MPTGDPPPHITHVLERKPLVSQWFGEPSGDPRHYTAYEKIAFGLKDVEEHLKRVHDLQMAGLTTIRRLMWMSACIQTVFISLYIYVIFFLRGIG